MAKFLYRLENGNSGSDHYVLDLDNGSIATASLKYAVRHLAARHIESGSLDLSQQVVVEDGEGRLIDRCCIGDHVRIA